MGCVGLDLNVAGTKWVGLSAENKIPKQSKPSELVPDFGEEKKNTIAAVRTWRSTDSSFFSTCGDLLGLPSLVRATRRSKTLGCLHRQGSFGYPHWR